MKTTRDIKTLTIERITELANLSGDQLRDAVMYLTDCLKSKTVTIEVASASPSSPVPAYNRDVDGDYSAWLVSNNID